jgi:hypothetical protein
VYATLTPRDFFGGRTLIEGEYDSKTGEVIAKKPAKFRVVAHTANVSLYIITKQHLSFLLPAIIT